MPTNDTTAKEATAPVFGYDQAGNCHRYDAVRATVIVTRDGAVTHTEALSNAAVRRAWIPHVRATCGWIDQWFDADVLPVDRHQAAKVRAADICYDRAQEAV